MKRRTSIKRRGSAILLAVPAFGSLVVSLAHQDALGSAQQERFRKVPVVMIVLDELPIATLMDDTGHIDATLFPNFARIQRDSTWFRNTTTPAVFTREAVPSILTGLYPEAVNAANGRTSVFSLLPDAYDIPFTHQHDLIEPDPDISLDETPVSTTCPSNACENASKSMTRLEDRYGHLLPGERGAELLRFLSYIRARDKPTLYFLHYVMPHQPWRYLPTGQTYAGTRTIPDKVNVAGLGKEWVDDPWLVVQAYQRHLLQTTLLDRQLGILIDLLEEEGLYDRSLIVLTADHGIAFEPGESKRVIVEDTIGHIAAVPLLVKEPFQSEGRISDRPLETIDVVPTMMDILSSWDGPPRLDGISAYASDFSSERARTSRDVPLDTRVQSKFRVADMKYETFGQTGGRIDLFELGPGRTRSFVGSDVAEFDVTSPAELTVTLDNASDIEEATPDMTLLPALLKGRFNADDAPVGAKIAVALNDRVVAMTRSGRSPSGDKPVSFYALLPPKWFESPPNDLDVYLVEDVATRTLAPLTEEPKESGLRGG